MSKKAPAPAPTAQDLEAALKYLCAEGFAEVWIKNGKLRARIISHKERKAQLETLLAELESRR